MRCIYLYQTTVPSSKLKDGDALCSPCPNLLHLEPIRRETDAIDRRDGVIVDDSSNWLHLPRWSEITISGGEQTLVYGRRVVVHAF